MMKRKLQALALLAFLLVGASCEREQGKPLLIEPGKTITDGGFLGLSIQSPKQVVLRSTEADPMKQVSSVSLLFYNSSSHLLEHVREFKVSSPSELSKLVVKLPVADYDLIVVANAGDKLRAAFNPGAPLSDFSTPKNMRGLDLFDSARGVFMTNEQGAVSVPSSAFATATEAVQSAISVTIEPALARVLVYGTPKLSRGVKGAAKPMYQVANLAKQVTLLRQMNKLSDGADERAGDNSLREHRYAKSSYWDVWEQSRPQTIEDIAYYSAGKDNVTEMQVQVKERYEDFSAQLSQSFLYAKETTLPPNSYLEGITPCVTIAYPYVPQGLQLADDEGWVSYKGRYYRENDVRAMLRTTSEATDPELVEAMRQNRIDETTFVSSKGFETAGIRFYYKAYNYYTVYIRHFSTDVPTSGYGKYGIVRGNEYRIKIAEIASAGSPVPPSYKGNMKPITDHKASDISVRIAEITQRDQEVQL